MSFTPEEEQRIAQLMSQFNLSETLPATGVGIHVNAPELYLSFPNPPPAPISFYLNAQADSRGAALSDIDGQVERILDAGMAAINTWIASLNNHQREFEIYREAYRRARERL